MSPKSDTTGIKKDRNGWRVWQRVHPGPCGLKSKRFPKTATEREMREWQEEQRVAFRLQRKVNVHASRGTLAADIVTYLKLVPTMPSLTDRTRDLQAWSDILGMKPRAKLTTNDYRLVLQQWRLAGGKNGKALAASTVNHRRTALLHLYRLLDGKAAPNPLREIRPFPEPPPEPRDIGLTTARELLGKAQPNKSGARLKVLAWTGIRGPSEFGKMKPEHVDLVRGICWVPTGKKGKPRELVLNASGIAAWQEVIDRKAWGAYSSSSLRRAFNRCVLAVNLERLTWFVALTLAVIPCRVSLLVGLRPYDLRHTIATALRKAGADLADVQAFLGHTSQRMTQRYAPYHSEKLRSAMETLDP